ncbi:MAG: hypothetical protein DCO96_14980 [Fluviicola sp. XM-24bin1]|nr:MAG: hypothetical protein DCO96_14980 [Fluviicola sp. XM-24bin1]
MKRSKAHLNEELNQQIDKVLEQLNLLNELLKYSDPYRSQVELFESIKDLKVILELQQLKGNYKDES